MERRKVCRYFERGSCRKDNCPFVHIKENRKTCNFYLEGNCRKGAACNFYHPPKEQEKLANLKEELKKKLKNEKKQEQIHQEQEEDVETHIEKQKQEPHEVENQEKIQKNEIKQLVKENQKQGNQQKETETQKIEVVTDKIQKINFLLGINSEDSDSDSQQQQQEAIIPKQQIQFLKIYPKKFPDFSKTPQMKSHILKNEQKYFKGQKYLNYINKITDPLERQYYQVIRKFTDSFEPIQNEPQHYTIKMRPLLYEKEINLNFQFVEDTINLEVDARGYPQDKAKFIILNKSIPEEYKEKFIMFLNRMHEKKSVFDTLKFLQNNFQKIYEESRFRLENEFYSKKEIDRKLKEEVKKQGETKIPTGKQQARKIKRPRKVDQHPDIKIIKYKEGEKIENLHYNYQLSVESIIMQNCEYLVVDKILCFVQCVCEKRLVYIFDMTGDRSLVVGVKLQCKKCNAIILMGIQRDVVQFRKEILGRIAVNNGHLIDVGGVGFKIGCVCNNQISKGKLYLSGERITANCHNCFQSMLITYMGLKTFNPILRLNQIRTDHQLPGKGSCKHMKLSFRWFRYGCCGRCFSCDDCHIMESINVHEKVKGITMLCGYCSRQQPVGSDCHFCHKQLVKGVDKSGHWEGGFGCRDQALLSRKDAKKYAGLTKKKEKDK